MISFQSIHHSIVVPEGSKVDIWVDGRMIFEMNVSTKKLIDFSCVDYSSQE